MEAGKTFSMKEAIGHGFRMTKKYFRTIVCILLVYIGFEIASGVMGIWAGAPIKKDDVATVYGNTANATEFYTYLQESGYIDEDGDVQEKLQGVKSASELELPEAFEADRDRIYTFLRSHMYRLPFPKIIYYLIGIVLWLVGMVMSIGSVKIGLLLARDRQPAVSELFSNWQLFFPYLLGGVCYAIAVFGGFLLLIIPGFICMIMWQMYSYYIVDKNMGPIESMKASQALTKGVRWRLFGFGGLLILLNIGGTLCLFIGLLFTLPASLIAAAYVYDQLEKQSKAAGCCGPVAAEG